MPASTLPKEYKLYRTIDLVKNKREMIWVNVLSIVLMLLMFALGVWLIPVNVSWSFSSIDSLVRLLLHAALLLVCTVAYMILHEGVHGIFLRAFGKTKPRFGFKFLYAYAGSDAYFSKVHYMVIALAPLVLLGAVLLVLVILVPQNWVWFIYFIQIVNVSGAAGDMFVCGVVARLPKEVLALDDGTKMELFLPQHTS